VDSVPGDSLCAVACSLADYDLSGLIDWFMIASRYVTLPRTIRRVRIPFKTGGRGYALVKETGPLKVVHGLLNVGV
jgi:hypothetical protein